MYKFVIRNTKSPIKEDTCSSEHTVLICKNTSLFFAHFDKGRGLVDTGLSLEESGEEEEDTEVGQVTKGRASVFP